MCRIQSLTGALLIAVVSLAPAVAQQVPATEDLGRLRAVLREHGWGVDRAEDGSLLLYPGQPSEVPPAASPAQEPALDGLEEALAARGWDVRRQPDGSVVLLPGASRAADPVEPQPALRTALVAGADLDTLEALLRERGWRVRRTPTGELEVRLPEGHTRQGDEQAMPAVDWMPPGELELPVASARAARRLARDWLADSGLTGLAVGRARSGKRVYVVSIVEDRAPHRLEKQLVVRVSDGGVVVVQ